MRCFEMKETECGKKCEVYSRVVGYYRPVQNWNVGKREEFKDRLEYDIEKAAKGEFGEAAGAIGGEGAQAKHKDLPASVAAAPEAGFDKGYDLAARQ